MPALKIQFNREKEHFALLLCWYSLQILLEAFGIDVSIKKIFKGKFFLVKLRYSVKEKQNGFKFVVLPGKAFALKQGILFNFYR